MSTHTHHPSIDSFYFITFTCFRWLNLFEASHVYDYFPFWFAKLKEKGCILNGYVIMPNHIHMILYVTNSVNNFNRVIAESKRFLAYEIIRRLKLLGKNQILKILRSGVQENEKVIGKKHQVFRLSFDAKELTSVQSIERILDYIHANPVKGKWKLSKDFVLYPYSSARFYELGEKTDIEIVDYRDSQDIFPSAFPDKGL